MTVVNMHTGEIVEFDAAAAERRAERIVTRLDAIAENYARVLPMIREAIEKRDDIALGYRSPGDYVSDRFGQSLIGLDIEVRRAIVGELTRAGLSTRAIAPVVGVNNATVHRDLARVADATPDDDQMPHESYVCPNCDAHMGIAGGTGTDEDFAADEYFDEQVRWHESGECAPQTPESAAGGEASTDSGQTPQGEAASSHRGAQTSSPSAEDAVPVQDSPRPAVTGIDGKTYTRAEPTAPKRRPLGDGFRDAALDLDKLVGRWERLVGDDRFARNKNEVARYANDLIRAREALDRLIEQMTTNKETTND